VGRRRIGQGSRRDQGGDGAAWCCVRGAADGGKRKCYAEKPFRNELSHVNSSREYCSVNEYNGKLFSNKRARQRSRFTISHLVCRLGIALEEM